jgi:N-acetylglucosaminyldiphosphoundecaprenol N-acetyl-beta-D-mannosaminyltransferase
MNKLKKSLQAFSYFMPVSRQLCNDYNGVLDNSIVIKYIPHCIDYYPLDSELKIDKELNLICVGRLEPEKGFLYIIEIAKNLIKNNLNCKIHIIGDGSQMSQLKKAVADGDLINTIQLYGYREKEFVNSMLNSSRIFCMTSLQESFGIVLLEAFSYGLPCISFSSAQGACEIIDNGNNGYIIPAYDCEEYAKKIINLLIDKDTYVRMSNNARITSLNYLFSNVKEEWHSFIQEVVSERL